MRISNKNIGLFSGIIFLGFLSYHLSIKKSIQQYVLQQDLLVKINNDSYINDNYPSLVLFNNKLDSILSKRSFSNKQSLGNHLFEKLTEYTNHNRVKIISFSEPHTIVRSKQKNNLTYTYTIILQGDFKNILRTVHQIEKINLGSVISQSYVKEKNHKTGAYYLNNTILFQTTR